MKCPMFILFERDIQLGVESNIGECMMSICAWWDEEKNACSIKVIAKELTRIQLKGHKL